MLLRKKRIIKQIVIFYSESLSSYLLYSEFLKKYKDSISCIVKFPVVPRRLGKNSRRENMLFRVFKRSSWEFLYFNLCTIFLYQFFSFLFRNQLSDLARRLDIPTESFKKIDDRCIERVRAYNPRWILNNSPNILKEDILSLPSAGTLNYHAAKLPQFRGAGNYFWVIAACEEVAMATLHYVSEGLDSGDIITYSKQIPITKSMSVFELWYKLRYYAFPTYDRYGEHLTGSDMIPATPQDKSKVGVRSFPGREATDRVKREGRSIIKRGELFSIIKIAVSGKIKRSKE